MIKKFIHLTCNTKTMKHLITLLLLIGVFLSSCELTDEQKLGYFLSSEEYVIQVNFYSGGIVGLWVTDYHIKKTNLGYTISLNENEENSTFILLDSPLKDSFDLFIKEAFKTHNPDKKMIASCMGSGDTEYILKGSFVEKNLKPNSKCDSIFFSIVNKLLN